MIRGGLKSSTGGGGRPGAMEAEAIIRGVGDIGGGIGYEVVGRSM